MALSAEERRQWNELERQLVAEDPGPSQPIGDSWSTHNAASAAGAAGVVLALVIVLVAFLTVILAVIVKILLIGVLGFVLMIMGGTGFRTVSREGQTAVVSQPTSSDLS